MAAGVHDNPEVEVTPCVASIKSKNLIMLVGSPEVKTLYNHMGKVVATDNCNKSMD